AQDSDNVEPWRIITPAQSSLVYARDGSLIGEFGRQLRTSISIRTLPKYVPQAFVAVEDQRFYQHDGVDIVGIGGALKDMVGGKPRGASTITQQLVGNMHPTIVDRTDRSLGRKLREQAAAREMEKHYSKEQILEAYLNQISFGHGWYGIETASRRYFGKSASRLTLAEAAALASMPKGPAIYDPIKYPDRVRQRRNVVLQLMVEQKYISRAEAERAKKEPVRAVPNNGLAVQAPYAVDAARRMAEQAGVPVMTGGFKIYTTIDPNLQGAASDALLAGTARVEARPGYSRPTLAKHEKGKPDYLQGAVIALDATSGDVLALVGGRDFSESPFNRATQALRQPGSSFKPLVYARAIADSIAPNEIVSDTAIAISMDNRTVYRPKNADGEFLGPLTLREALVHSRNPVAVQLAQRITMDSVAALASNVGLETPVSRFPAAAIGASEVHPLDFVATFTTFANNGAAVEPRLIRRVEDRSGRTVLAPGARDPVQVLDPGVAFIVRDMMRDVVERGTAKSVRSYVPGEIPVAGKTGTTDDNTDVWFVGMTPEIVAGVWLGFDRPATIAPGAAGGTLAAPIWGDMIARAYRERHSGSWNPPENVVAVDLDRVTGLPADDLTPPERRYTEYFLSGTEPGGVRLNPWAVFSWGPITW
ncbi:MAG TPA: PBP1A family penicillin-binding protein, partial [Gemmatimonadaceae bacterium]|nr:PBP1A family penicillin-binding protein [Gemmatimonadaceae bacterium]